MAEKNYISAKEVSDKKSQISPDSQTLEAILKQLQKNEEISQDILKAVVFIKSHYFWRSVFYGLKILILVLVIVLGVVSWRSIVEYATITASGLPTNIMNNNN